MARLVLHIDGMPIHELALDAARLSIGRRPDNDLQIDNLAVSGRHALVGRDEEGCFVEDLASTNGTLVNGLPVGRQPLRDGDRIEIGRYCLHYLEGGRASGEARAVPPQDLSLPPPSPSAAPLPLAGLVPPDAPSAFAAGEAAVQVLNGPNAGRTLILAKATTTLGKPGVQVAAIVRRPPAYFITHLEGANFPRLNGRELDGQAHRLRDRDVLEIAGVSMEFFLKTGG